MLSVLTLDVDVGVNGNSDGGRLFRKWTDQCNFHIKKKNKKNRKKREVIKKWTANVIFTFRKKKKKAIQEMDRPM